MTASTLNVRVAHKATEAIDISSYELVDVDGRPLPPFSAGSHIDVHLPDGIVRQYSLCNDPGETHRYLIGVLRDAASRGGSKAMHDGVRIGDVLRISAPKNHFALAHGATRHLLLAGGIGITPILCMAERLANSGADFAMHYSTRCVERTAFRERILGSAFAPRVQFHVDDGPAAQKLDLAALLAAPERGVHLYVCGPRGFMEAVLGSARAAGWPEEQLHCEFFAGEVAKSADDKSFKLKLASSGRIVVVPPEQTVVQALATIGVEIPTSCGEGICGTCITRVIDGECDHKDLFLSPGEQAKNDQFTPCCSRAKSAMLVLDL
jgi:vanillate O-demethylase ferredoxin subunit